MMRLAARVAAGAGAVLLAVVALSTRGSGPATLLESVHGLAYPMNAEALGDSGLVTAKAQMAFGGMEALQRQVDEMDINWGNKPKHVRQSFADAYGRMNALKKLVSHMEMKDFDSGSSRLAATPDEALQAVMQPGAENRDDVESPEEIRDEHRVAEDQSDEDAGLRAAEAAGRMSGLRSTHSMHLRGRQMRRRPSSASADRAVMPPFMGQRKIARTRAAYDPALNLSGAQRRRLAQRAAARIGAGAYERGGENAVVSPPWTR
jgi:hypothetical protein